MTKVKNILNQMSIFSSKRRKDQLPDSIIDSGKDVAGISGTYKANDAFKPYTISGSEVSASKMERVPQDEESADEIELANETQQLTKHERWYQTTLQVSIPFFLAGIGTIAAGVILGHVKRWGVFQEISELFILVPALMGLKGNLDMTLASRLSTQANLGNMTSAKKIAHMVVGNIALVQVQATVASFIVALFAFGVGFAFDGMFNLDHAFLLVASSMFTATTSCFVLDFVLVAVIIVSNKYKVNPDNLATPLAASIGDVIALSLLSLVSSILFANLATHLWITYVVIGVYFLLLPLWTLLVLRNIYTRPVLIGGWVPVLSALFISSMGGLVMENAVGEFPGFVVFQPIINGIGGNLVSVQASKISTALHQSSPPGVIPDGQKIFETPVRALVTGTPYARSARVLILISIPGQVIFIFVADLIHVSASTIGAPFVFTFIAVSLIQVVTLLFIAHVLIHSMWRFKVDPDSAAIPYLTALGDLFGSTLLWGAFAFLRFVGHGYKGRPAPFVTEFLIQTFDLLHKPFGCTMY